MRTVSATLLAAQREPTQRPRLQLNVADRRPYSEFAEAEAQYDVPGDMDVCSDGTILAAAVHADGHVYVRTMGFAEDLPASPGNWVGFWSVKTGWTKISSTAGMAGPTGDVAVGASGSEVCVFYIGATGQHIHCLRSTDDGTTWGAVETVKDWGGAVAENQRLSSGQSDRVWFCRGTVGDRYVYYRTYGEGSWGSEQPLAGLTESVEFGACYGLAGGVWTSSGFLVAGAFDGDGAGADPRIAMEYHNEAGTSESGYLRIVPPGYGAAGWLGKCPSLCQASVESADVLFLTWWDSYASGSKSWGHHRMMRSLDDGDHWTFGQAVRVGSTSGYSQRLAVAQLADDGPVYWWKCNAAGRFKLWLSSDTARNLATSADILNYRMDEHRAGGRLEIELDNRAGTYDTYTRGSDGGGEALQPLAEVTLEQGLVTSAGTERVEGRVFLLWDVGWVRQRNRNWLRVEAADPLDLFRIWKPPYAMVFTSQTLQWCIEELVMRVCGLECAFDGSSEWSTTYDYMAFVPSHVDPTLKARIDAEREARLYDETGERRLDAPFDGVSYGGNGYTMLQRLLGLAGAAARWGDGNNVRKLYCWIPDNEGDNPAADYTYQRGELRQGVYFRSFQWPNFVRAVGDGQLTVLWQEEEAGSTGPQDVQQVLSQVVYNEAWDAGAECDAAAEAALDAGMERRGYGHVKAWPHAGLEVGDFVAIADPWAGGGSVINDTYRVSRLWTEYNVVTRKWSQRVYFVDV